MGRRSTKRQGQANGSIVAFDFDGTLSIRDSFKAFLAWRSGPVRYAAGLLLLLPACLIYVFTRDRGRLKAAAVRVFLRGLPREKFVAACEEFARSTLGRAFLRPDAEQCWAEWRAKGARLVIVTASPEELIAPFARRLGADDLIGTRLVYDASGRLDGRFDGPNCRAQEKVVRLEAAYGPGVRLAAAYGDSSGDVQMLQIAEVKGYRVFHGRPSQTLAENGGARRAEFVCTATDNTRST